MKPYIYITRKLPAEAVSSLKGWAEVGMWNSEDEPVPRETLLAEAGRADALLAMLSDSIDQELLSHAKLLKVVANLAVGFDNIDVSYATERGIAVCNTPDILTDTTADLTFGLILAAARRMVESAEYVKQGKWQSWSPLLMAGLDVHHKTIGIVGMGNIGRAVAKRAAGFEMEILYHNRSRSEEAEQNLGARYVPFEELLEKADFVVCLTPLTEETKGLFNAEAFKRMKSTAVFVNAARGAVADEMALYEALSKGEIAAAGLDVFEKEPIGADHPLLELPNVVALPHIGSASTETRFGMMKLCGDNIKAVLSGRLPLALVNKEWHPA